MAADGAGQRTVRLSNGTSMPLLGLGTGPPWSAKGDAAASVRAALSCGYRHIDAAPVYGNEAEVGEAIGASLRELGLSRAAIFVTSKLFNSEHDPAHVHAACAHTLADLGLDYLDMYLIHWPQQFEKCGRGNVSRARNADGSIRYAHIRLADTWAAMEALVDAGLVRAIGVSNFNVKQLRSVCEGARIKPACNQVVPHSFPIARAARSDLASPSNLCNQVESHPFFAQTELRATCDDLGVLMSACAPPPPARAPCAPQPPARAPCAPPPPARAPSPHRPIAPSR